MNIFAAGILKAAGSFLHAGYISACPRTLDPRYFESARPPLLQVEVKEALRLEGEALVGGPAVPAWPDALPAPDAALAAVGPSHAWIVLLAGTGLFFLVVAIAFRSRLRPRTRVESVLAGGLALALAAPLLFLCAGSLRAGPGDGPAAPPWEGVAPRKYVHPDTATRVILYGLVADGLSNTLKPVASLAEIRNEVGFPSAELSEGQTYALKTYGLDGWGTPFRLASEETNRRTLYHVASAGPDRRFDTADDLALHTARCSDHDWDRNRWAYFVRRDRETTYVFYHRWNGAYFVHRDRETAVLLTGSALFDVAYEGLGRPARQTFHRPWKMEKFDGAFQAAAGAAKYEPLVLCVIDRGRRP